MTNREQIDYWNEQAGPEWVAEQARLDETVATFGNAVLERANIQAGESVLDVGCGTGQTTVAAARTAAGGRVLGADVSRVMLEAAKRRAAEAGVSANFVEADAQVHDFGEKFDHVISRFGVMFFEDPTAAFANLARATEPGGRLTFVCWQALPKNAWVALPARSLADVVPLPPREPGEPGPFAFADGERVRTLLDDAGWNEIRIESVERMSSFGDGSVEGTLEFLLTIGPLASAVRGVEDPEQRQRAIDVVTGAVEAEAKNGKVELGTATWIVEAVR
ncbi:MAG: class I SAM-dependent methyltransferase [Acidobacteriota bacterium]